MRNKTLLLWLIYAFLFSQGVLSAQSGLKIGEWKSHLSYKDGKRVCQSSGNVYYASSRGLISIFKEDLSVKFMSKEDGLSDISIANMFYDDRNNQLILIYADNNIDVIQDEDVYNLPFIKTNTSITGSKTINDFHISNQKDAYMATDFGILGFNLQKLEFPFTTFTETKVYSIVTLGNTIYAGTARGLYTVSIDGVNISDFNTWQLAGPNIGLPAGEEVKYLAVKFGKVYLAAANKVYVSGFDGRFSVLLQPDVNETVNYLSEDGSMLMAGIENNRNETRVLFYSDSGLSGERGYGCINKGIYSVEDQKGRIWYADQWDPIRYTEGLSSGPCKNLRFEVPFTNDASNVRFRKEKAYFGSGGVTEDYQYRFTLYGFYTLEDGSWHNCNGHNLT